MITIERLITFLKTEFPTEKFYNGVINRQVECIGLFLNSAGAPNIALGGYQNTSYCSLQVTFLIYGGQNSSICEERANALYQGLVACNNCSVGTHRIISFQPMEQHPIHLGRDDVNNTEMSFRINIIYER